MVLDVALFFFFFFYTIDHKSTAMSLSVNCRKTGKICEISNLFCVQRCSFHLGIIQPITA